MTSTEVSLNPSLHAERSDAEGGSYRHATGQEDRRTMGAFKVLPRARSAHRRRTESTELYRVAGGLAGVAGLIHLYVAPAHFVEEGLAFGVFMLVVGAAQMVVGVAFLEEPTRAPVQATIIGTLLVVLLYLVSRTTGLPFGPHPGRPEGVDTVDVVSKATELTLLWVLLSLPHGERIRSRARS